MGKKIVILLFVLLGIYFFPIPVFSAIGPICQTLQNKISAAYDSTCGDVNYDPVADIDKDKDVDLYDLTVFNAKAFDEAWCQSRLDDTSVPCATPPPPTFGLINPLACNTIPECIEKIIGFIFWVAMAIVPIIIIIAGFLFLTSGGDPEKVRTAKGIILWAVIGLFIILLAKGIISLIKTVIGS